MPRAAIGKGAKVTSCLAKAVLLSICPRTMKVMVWVVVMRSVTELLSERVESCCEFAVAMMKSRSGEV